MRDEVCVLGADTMRRLLLTLTLAGCVRTPPIDRETYCAEEKTLNERAKAAHADAVHRADESYAELMKTNVLGQLAQLSDDERRQLLQEWELRSSERDTLRAVWQQHSTESLQAHEWENSTLLLVMSCYNLAADLNNAQKLRDYEANRAIAKGFSDGFQNANKPTVTCTTIGNVTTCK